ncbi:MAG: glycosyltransferase family 2 protein [Planctomycetaceae bacterium]
MAIAPRFSIIIPTYNYGRYVGRAIASALSQSGGNFETLVVDDGSTDDTPQVVQSFGQRVHYRRHENRGAAATRNRGADLADGDWLLFLDADDRLLPGALDRFRHAVREHPAARMIFGHHVSVSEDGRRRESTPQPRLSGPLTNFRDFVDRKFGIAHGTAILHRDVFGRLKYPSGITNGEDIVLFAQTLALFECATFPHPTAEIHAHPGRMRNNVDAFLATGLQTVDALFRADVLPPDAMRLRRLFECRRHLSLARSLYKAGRYPESRHCYLQALRSDWRRAISWTNAGRFLKTTFRVSRSRESRRAA